MASTSQAIFCGLLSPQVYAVRRRWRVVYIICVIICFCLTLFTHTSHFITLVTVVRSGQYGTAYRIIVMKLAVVFFCWDLPTDVWFTLFVFDWEVWLFAKVKWPAGKIVSETTYRPNVFSGTINPTLITVHIFGVVHWGWYISTVLEDDMRSSVMAYIVWSLTGPVILTYEL